MRNLRHAVRILARTWLFSLAAIAILALCIGVNTAVLAVVDAVLIRPLPYPSPEGLLQIVAVARHEGAEAVQEWHTGATWEAIRDGAAGLDAAVIASGGGGVNLALGGTARHVRQHRVSAGFFRVLGVAPARGREFTPAEDRVNGPPVAILSHALWRTTFGADASIVGRRVLLRGEPYTVVGVMPAGFQPLLAADLWTPLRPTTTGEGSGTNFQIIGRVRQAASPQEAQEQLARVSADLARQRGVDPSRAGLLQTLPLRQGLSLDARRPLVLLWSAVAAVFLIGCVNVGGMLLARSAARAGEVATRLALGARPGHIVRQLMTESLVLALAGGMAAVLVGQGALAALRAYGATTFPALETARLDWRVLAATLALTLVATLVLGLLPAWQAARVDLRAAQGTARTVAGRRRFVSLGLLVGSQVALTLPLLLGAGLLLRTLSSLWHLEPGFDPSNVVTARFSLQDARYASAEKTRRFLEQTAQRLQMAPGVEAAAASLSLPYERALNMPIGLAGQDPGRPSLTNLSYVTPGYFAALKIPILQGRAFSDHDGPDAARVAIANEAFVAMYFGDRPAIGELVRLGQDAVQIVGVSASVQQRRAGWGRFGPVAPVPNLYIPAAQTSDRFLALVHTWFSPSWIVRSARPGGEVVAAIEETMRAADPMLPIAAFRSFDELKHESLATQQLLGGLVGALGALALALTALGIYGLLANLVGERSRELGIRMALGSTVARAIRTAVRPALVWVAAGLAAGAALAIPASGVLRSFLWEVTTLDPATLAGVGLGFIATALAASAAPALRILRLNPAETLRGE